MDTPTERQTEAIEALRSLVSILRGIYIAIALFVVGIAWITSIDFMVGENAKDIAEMSKRIRESERTIDRGMLMQTSSQITEIERRLAELEQAQ